MSYYYYLVSEKYYDFDMYFVGTNKRLAKWTCDSEWIHISDYDRKRYTQFILVRTTRKLDKNWNNYELVRDTEKTIIDYKVET